MDYLFLLILSCIINSAMISPENIRINKLIKINAELFYKDSSLLLEITNISDDSIYLQTNIFDNVKIYYQSKRIDDINFLYNTNDLPPIKDPQVYDSTNQLNKQVKIGTFINYANPKEADSVILEYFLKEYKELNKKDTISYDEIRFLISKLNVIMFLKGGFLFLLPNQSYIFKYDYSCFRRFPGEYKVMCNEKSRKYKDGFIYLKGSFQNKDIKLPVEPPLEFMGYTRYDNEIKCKTKRFSTVP